LLGFREQRFFSSKLCFLAIDEDRVFDETSLHGWVEVEGAAKLHLLSSDASVVPIKASPPLALRH
jgi:hypothetical protein